MLKIRSQDSRPFGRLAFRSARSSEPRIRFSPLVVLLDESYRGQDLSYQLMQRSIELVRDRYGLGIPITVGAQTHLQRLYNKLGFVATSDAYDEDGIPHIEMTYWLPLWLRRESDLVR